MKHKVSELEGALLDAAVAVAEGWERFGQGWHQPCRIDVGNEQTEAGFVWFFEPFSWSSHWAQGGPIIERELIKIEAESADLWHATGHYINITRSGRSALTAAMRLFVACRFGEEVELP